MDSNCMRANLDCDRPGERVPTNPEFQEELSALVVHEVLRLSGQSHLKVGPLEILDFSSTFSIDWGCGGERQGVFVKVPKVEIGKLQVGLVTPADRRFAAEEYDSLVRLSQAWQGDDLRVNFVKPLAFLSGYNAIVTQRAYAREFFKLFRHTDRRGRRQGPGADNELIGCLNRLGRVLDRYHRSCSEASRFEIGALGVKIQGYLARLDKLQAAPALLAQIDRALKRLRGRVAATHLTDTIKGLDVRNILIDLEGRLFLLDPGKLKRDYREADLARFLVTCRILYWGSLWFFLHLTPHDAYERSFLRAYYDEAGAGDWVLTVFTIKELLKHWLMAHTALGLKRWPQTLKWVVRRTYIDPFYQEQITDELRKLAQGSGF